MPAMGELLGYAMDCLVRGSTTVGEGRLADQLDAVLMAPIRDARLVALEDGRVVQVPELTLERDEICAVVAGDPRGDPSRRLHTRTARVRTEVGPYSVEGTVHGTVAAEPIGRALRLDSWVPMTDATVMYRRSSEEVADEVPVLLVNRRLLQNLREIGKPVPAGAGQDSQDGDQGRPA